MKSEPSGVKEDVTAAYFFLSFASFADLPQLSPVV